MGSVTLRVTRLSLYLAWTVSLMPIQALGLAFRRSWSFMLPGLYHRRCCRLLGIRVRTIGTPTRKRPALFVSNHISYVDITVLGSLIPASFIAKAEVADWPLFGLLAKLQRTVFIDRQIRNAHAQCAAVTRRLGSGDALILFPEATSSDGSRVLPFKSALFGALESTEFGVPVAVQPVSIAYTRLDGIPLGRLCRPLFAWYGAADLAPHLWNMIGLGIVEVVVEFHPPTCLADFESRKALCGYCHGRISGGLAAANSGRPQPVPDLPRAGVSPIAEAAAG